MADTVKLNGNGKVNNALDLNSSLFSKYPIFKHALDDDESPIKSKIQKTQNCEKIKNGKSKEADSRSEDESRDLINNGENSNSKFDSADDDSQDREDYGSDENTNDADEVREGENGNEYEEEEDDEEGENEDDDDEGDYGEDEDDEE